MVVANKQNVGLISNPFDVLSNDNDFDESDDDSIIENDKHNSDSGIENLVAEELQRKEEQDIMEEMVHSKDEDGDEEQEEEEEEEEEESTDSDEYDEDLLLEAQLLDAQRQWEESLQQLNKVLNWLFLPLLGKFLGRRTSRVIWKRVMNYLW
ncbi:hypothetical protein Kpol_543p50 [Vanderwaltozyma polyspora DSM 70294]|uniref:Uncharacterized protein n=1 Tax=Vanderwaltozyma polyspora (strain ATCC 22028 / DSM 70294 / BCRC 21397 / CBS 2163 / NBRC 10782 / NRRL Y-8283 / UCD 57-17) TaxID=436907 RepID=A7THQ4_VANPO|nr:uncharacterized protein Kpol_543p50 [Vanderwaltozyma polyspora DSM 70294]EDO18220.1 hypothetical protein Kpol_543p50 [Vanderwaltozyma polyspora DSM 70294]